MSGDVRRRLCAWVAALLVSVSAAGCASAPVEPVTTDAWVDGGLPAYCWGRGGVDEDFWDLVHDSCTMADDGDVEQAVALRTVLGALPAEEVAAFHRTFMRLNRGLRSIRDVADDLCAPGLGLGQDLGTDYRSWVIAHGQDAYEAVRDDPERLRDFPDATAGCGRGEPYGFAALDVYREMTGTELAPGSRPTTTSRITQRHVAIRRAHTKPRSS